MDALPQIPWSQACGTPRGILDWFERRLSQEPVSRLQDVFSYVVALKMSIREYWLQLQLHYMLGKEFEASSGKWRVMECEPPAVVIPVPGRAEPYLKWPDLLVIRKDARPGFYWWELKWIARRDMLKRFLVDAWLIGQMCKKRTAEHYANGKKGGWWKSLCTQMGSDRNAIEAIESGTHIVLALAAITDAKILSGEGPIEQAAVPSEIDFPAEFRGAARRDFWRGTDPSSATLALSGERRLGLLAWRSEIG